MLKKWRLFIAGSFLAILLIYFVFIGYLVSGGFKNYVAFCSEYFPYLEEFHEKNLEYPENISDFSKPNYYPRHEVKECHYSKIENGFIFSVSEGLMGVAIYNSNKEKWFHD